MLNELLITSTLFFIFILLKTEEYKFVELDNTKLLIGYSCFKKKIIADMIVTPHILVSGLPNQGKSKLIRQMLINLRGANIIIYGGFKEDYKGIHYRNLKNEEELNIFLDNILNNLYVRKEPLYVVIEEISTIRNKKVKEKIQELLCIARHYAIYVIGVIQIATKENCIFKDLFGVRISFKQIGEQNYRVLFGMTIDEKYRNLNQQEFIMLSDRLVHGITYCL